MNCFVVALGQGQVSTPLRPFHETSLDLRSIVDRAAGNCEALEYKFPDDFVCSVAPHGILVAFKDDTATRVCALLGAIGSVIETDRPYREISPQVAVSIAYGHLRSVETLGYSTNFEGVPAIAAARILARLRTGQIAIDQSVWEFPELLQDCPDEITIEGKHSGETFRVRTGWRFLETTSIEATPPTAPVFPTTSPVRRLSLIEQYLRRELTRREQERREEHCLTEDGRVLVPPLVERVRRKPDDRDDEPSSREKLGGTPEEKEESYTYRSIDLPTIVRWLAEKNLPGWAILGDSGTGKTTLLKEIVAKIGSKDLSTVFVPLYFHFRELEHVRTHEVLFGQIADKWHGLASMTEIAVMISDLFSDGRLVFLLDGLDQVPEGQHQCMELLLGRDSLLQPNKVIFAGRPYAFNTFDRGLRLSARFSVASIESFDEEQTRIYLGQFYQETKIREIFGKTGLALRIPILLAHLRTLASKRRLAEVITPSDIYKEFLDIVLNESLDKMRRYIGPAPDKVAAIKMLAKLSYETLNRGYRGSFPIEIKYPALTDALRTTLTEFDTLTRLGIVSRLIEESTGGTFVFCHQSFQEYLASMELKDKVFPGDGKTIDKEALLDHLEHVYWDEVWVFLAGQLDSDRTTTVIRAIEPYDHYLAIKCLCRSRSPISQHKDLLDQAFQSIADWEVRESLARIGGQLIKDRLIALLQDEHSFIRLAAAEALATLNVSTPDVLNELLALLQDDAPPVREAAITALGRFHEPAPEILNQLITLTYDTKPRIRGAATEALGTLNTPSPEVLKRLLALLQDSNSMVRSVAVEALGALKITTLEILNRLVTLLQDSDSMVRSAAVKTLRAFKFPTQEPLNKLLLLAQDADPNIRWAGVLALGALKISTTEVLNLLLALADDPDPGFRIAAALALEELKITTPEVLNKLLVLLQDADSTVRTSAAEALGSLKLPDQDVIRQLLAIISNQYEYGFVQGPALEALGEIATKMQDRDLNDLVAQLSKKLSDTRNWDNRKTIEQALHRIRHTTGRRFLRIEF